MFPFIKAKRLCCVLFFLLSATFIIFQLNYKPFEYASKSIEIVKSLSDQLLKLRRTMVDKKDFCFEFKDKDE